jgi:arginine decarboxylase
LTFVGQVPRYFFLTKGVGRHKEQLASFELALRDAGISAQNLVQVSSIIPPKCKLLSREDGTKLLNPGEITYCVLARNSTDEDHRLIAASVGVAIPAGVESYGYLSEWHTFGQTDEMAGEYAEDLAATMLATILGIPFDPNADWDEREQVFKTSGKIIRTTNITQSAVGEKNHTWTTVVAVAVFID